MMTASNGKTCPVAPGTYVNLLYADGYRVNNVRADWQEWNNESSFIRSHPDWRIVSYRVA